MVEFRISAKIPAKTFEIYSAWLDSQGHKNMTGAPANVSDQKGAEFEAWDGYITGKNLELEAPRRILQAWRTVEFGPSDEDSLLEVVFESLGDETLVQINHTNLPEHGEQYKQGWVDNYFEPMRDYFGS